MSDDVFGTCTICGKPLRQNKTVWLELDQRINAYHDFGGIPGDKNQGGFEFGPDCAEKQRLIARAAIAKARGEA